ncbi:hypothetical protein O6H91_11G006500 [Diphasiastrum complanatum]|uniref:Uncharacterized protein n=2 Tax=Diphasiastrum complanatum TaxID=34168 RepID=A0ACC2C625_DIPCM|nr:hypothetical protein O6H91_11G006500 [Diphasiastrum complanatum]KAJ7537462.1 hypothetical protein O6H91_11G006500 [Diphasiastrum complanatum]
MAGLSCSNAAAVSFSINLFCQEANAVGRGGLKWFAGSQRRVMRWGNRAVNAPAAAAAAGGDDRGGGGSYLSMWKRAQERQEKERLKLEEERLQQELREREAAEREEALRKRREEQFARLLEVPQEERDRVQRLEVVDRAAAALAAAEALLSSKPPSSFSANKPSSNKNDRQIGSASAAELKKNINTDTLSDSGVSSSTVTLQHSPGPDFWTWSPPLKEEDDNGISSIELLAKVSSLPASKPVVSVLELDRPQESLSINLESEASQANAPNSLPLIFQSRARPSLPPLQSLFEVEKETAPQLEADSVREILLAVPDLESTAASAVELENQRKGKAASGVNVDGSRWWRETGVDHRENGVTCNWTVTRGISNDGAVEWEEKFWEASDQFDYKELGAEKSGRDAFGNVWREFWQEAMWQDSKTGLVHMEKSADKWGKNGIGGQWHEKWWEHYDASGRAEKWADKWSQIDHSTSLEPGHAHVWHERWGEEFDGHGGCMKYSDKWAERAEVGGSWTKWGDKWDERFHQDSKGIKQGETWWEGANGERWNRTWGEGHNATGWVHKYGKSSSGEHWDCHEPQETWYERKAHYGFFECLDNSQELQRVGKRRNQGL